MQLLRRILRTWGRRTERLPHGRAFVSLSYADEAAVTALASRVPRSVRLRVFPPVVVPPQEMVSSRFLEEIRGCRSLIAIDSERSRRSRWVTLERDYALRIGIPVFDFDPSTGLLRRVREAPLDLSVFPSYSRKDQALVKNILRVMREERYFDVFLDEEMPPDQPVAHSLESGMIGRLQRGGRFVLFLSPHAVSSEWVAAELRACLSRFPNQLLVAELGPTAPALVPRDVVETAGVRLYDESGSPSANRIDDLIVWIYWLTQDWTRARGAAS